MAAASLWALPAAPPEGHVGPTNLLTLQARPRPSPLPAGTPWDGHRHGLLAFPPDGGYGRRGTRSGWMVASLSLPRSDTGMDSSLCSGPVIRMVPACATRPHKPYTARDSTSRM